LYFDTCSRRASITAAEDSDAISGNEWSLEGGDDGVYLLDVIVNMPNGQTGAFETVLVILAHNAPEANPTQVIKQVIQVEIKTKTKEIIFKDKLKQKPKPSICYFDPDNKACDLDPKTGKCPPGFGFNQNLEVASRH
jgi:hypothetical protein